MAKFLVFLLVISSTIYADDAWKPKSNFYLSCDREGKSTPTELVSYNLLSDAIYMVQGDSDGEWINEKFFNRASSDNYEHIFKAEKARISNLDDDMKEVRLGYSDRYGVFTKTDISIWRESLRMFYHLDSSYEGARGGALFALKCNIISEEEFSKGETKIKEEFRAWKKSEVDKRKNKLKI